MANKFATSIDLRKHSLKHAKLNPLTQTQINALSLGVADEGYHTFNTDTNFMQVWDGSAWIIFEPNMWQRNTTTLSPKTANDVVSVISNGAVVIYGESSAILGKGLSGKASLGYGVHGEGLVGLYGKGVSTGGSGVSGVGTVDGAGGYFENVSSTEPTLKSTKRSSVTNAVVPLEQVVLETTGTAADGLGISKEWLIEDDSGTNFIVATQKVIMTDASTGSVSSQWEWYHGRAGTWERCLAILSTGQVVFDLYPGSITGTWAKTMGMTSAGELIPFDHRKIVYARTITDATDDLEATDIGKMVTGNRATAQTFSIPEGVMDLGDCIDIRQIGAGQITVAVANPTDQTISTACKTSGVDTVITLECVDDTANAEVFKVTGGVA